MNSKRCSNFFCFFHYEGHLVQSVAY